jgi:hypothetical protein
MWVGGRYRYNGPFDAEFNLHRNEYDPYGHRRYGTGYNEHVLYVQAHPPPPGRSPAELMQMRRAQEERMRVAGQQRQEVIRHEQIRINEQHVPPPRPVGPPVKHQPPKAPPPRPHL